MRAASMAEYELVAHRGLAARFPENTLAAMRAAIEAGARWLECDVQLSSDGVPFLFHDRALERITGERGALHARTASELDRSRASYRERFGERFAGEPLARLDAFVELLRAHPQVHAFVELKRVALDAFGAPTVIDQVLRELVPVRERTVLISFSVRALLAARERTSIPLGAVFDRWRDRAGAEVTRLAPEYVFCDLEGLPASGELRHAGARVAVYEIGDRALARALAARGVELIETFDVAALQGGSA